MSSRASRCRDDRDLPRYRAVEAGDEIVARDHPGDVCRGTWRRRAPVPGLRMKSWVAASIFMEPSGDRFVGFLFGHGQSSWSSRGSVMTFRKTNE